MPVTFRLGAVIRGIKQRPSTIKSDKGGLCGSAGPGTQKGENKFCLNQSTTLKGRTSNPLAKRAARVIKARGQRDRGLSASAN